MTPALRLSDATLDRASPAVERPGYDRAAVGIGVVHLGLGAFHRAHQAVVYDDLIRAGDRRWGVVGVSMRSPEAAERLAGQDGLYAVSIDDGGAPRDRIVGCLRRTLTAPRGPGEVIAALAAPDTHLVSLTVTETGYGPGPSSAAGLIAAGLAERWRQGLGGLTALSCDNLAGNGAALRAAVLAAAGTADPGLGDWIQAACAFPSTMVDRITPATTEADVEAFERRAGLRDEAVVRTEAFSQWVIENRFAGPRPDFEAAGVTLTSDVAPWEAAKLRLLNAAHSLIAYVGGLADVALVREVVATPGGRMMVEALWDEAETTLPPAPGLDLAEYRRALMARLANPALGHRTRQIAMDGSLKLPPRILGAIADRLAQGRSIDGLGLAAAAWIRWLGRRTDAGEAFALEDPLADRLFRGLDGARTAAERVDAALKVAEVFPPALAANPTFRQVLIRQLNRLDQGAGRVLDPQGAQE